MIWARQIFFCLTLLAVQGIYAQTEPASPKSVEAAKPQASPVLQTKIESPVNFFRKLLAMTPTERENFLTNRPPEVRKRILAKVEEYLILPPEYREIRLRATELRWWLTPMLSMSPAARERRLAEAPEDLRPLLQSRLEQWIILPAEIQDQLLASDRASRYFTLMPSKKQPTTLSSEQEKFARTFNQLFELTPEEKDQLLNLLSDDERAEMKDALEDFKQLSPEQRETCVRNYARFVGMSADERSEFLKNAEQWSKLSPEEREQWRNLVQQVPIWPVGWSPNQSLPVPPGVSPKSVATN